MFDFPGSPPDTFGTLQINSETEPENVAKYFGRVNHGLSVVTGNM